MELVHCLNSFMESLSSRNRAFTRSLETKAQSINSLIRQKGDTSPKSEELRQVTDFLVEIEKWKADCREEQTGNAERNEPDQIWSALKQAVNASDDRTALLSIMTLTGFGSARDRDTGQRRAKRATAVLRFLNPEMWGVVDWRVCAILGLYKKNKLNIGLAIQAGQKYKMNEMARLYDVVDEDAAIDIVRHYRSWRTPKLPRTVDVELALYGASFLAWPRVVPK